jgi:long-chain fatty acid transport protein
MKALKTVLLALVILLNLDQSLHAQFGSTLNGVGAVSRSMGGTTTAAPLDSLGAFQWNPSTISALPNSMDFGLELLMPRSTLSSQIDPGSLGGGFPPVQLAGATESDAGVYPLPEFGLVYRPDGSDLTLGVGILMVGGFGVNYPGSIGNPLLTPPPPSGLGVGPIYTQYQLMQVVPTAAFQLTDALSVSVSPVIGLAGLSADPGIVAAPDAAAGGAPTYPPMTHGAYQWGAGFQLGAFYTIDEAWQLGASFKSPQWFNDFKYNSRDQLGAARRLEFGLDAPMTVSIGAAYKGIDRWLFAIDAKYLDYANTEGYEASGFRPDGAIAGLGWDNVYAVSVGAQHELTNRTDVRMGYSYSTNPIDDAMSFYNVGAPLVVEHGLYTGAGFDVTERLKLSVAWSHYFENSVTGPIQTMGGPIAGTRVSSSGYANSLLFGATVLY